MRKLINYFSGSNTNTLPVLLGEILPAARSKESNSSIIIKNAPLDFLYSGLPFLGDSPNEIRAYTSLIYFEKCSAIATAVNMIADRFMDLKPRVYDDKAKKYLNDHEVLQLLKHPFGDIAWKEFAKQTAIYYLVSGNNFSVITGRTNKPPLELFNVHPGAVSIVPGSDGYAGKMIATCYSTVINFNRDESSGYFRFIDDLGMREIWQIKEFHPRSQLQANLYGMSPINPIYKEIEQLMQANNHNLYLLINQGKLSLLFTQDEPKPIPNDVRKRIDEQIKEKFSGSHNIGKASFLEGGLKVTELGQSNTDMDFFNLKKELKFDVFNHLKVPLALISTDAATMNNVENSLLMLYDNAVIPIANRIFDEFTEFLMPRYQGSENLRITFNENEVPALMNRKVQQASDKAKMSIYTINELRKELGLDDAEGGDNIFIPATNQPIATLAEPPEPAQDYVNALNEQNPKDKMPKDEQEND